LTIMTRSAARFFWKEELPKNVLYMYCEGGTFWKGCAPKWKEYTREEHNLKKKAKQDSNLRQKRCCLRKVPAYIYVFRNNDTFFFEGFFVMIVSRWGRWYLNWRVEREHKYMLQKIQQHFTCGLFNKDFNFWCKEFCRRFPLPPTEQQYPRGKHLVMATLNSYNSLIDIEFERSLESEPKHKTKNQGNRTKCAELSRIDKIRG